MTKNSVLSSSCIGVAVVDSTCDRKVPGSRPSDGVFSSTQKLIIFYNLNAKPA